MELEAVWNAYKKSLQQFLRTKISNDSDVEDLLQEILLKTHVEFGKGQQPTNIRAWLYKVARNAVIDHYRKAGRGKDIDPSDLWYEEESDKEHIFAHCLLPFIDALPDKSATLLKEIDIQRKSQKEMAASLGISYSTLKSQVQIARKELHGLFDECCALSLDGRGNIIDYHPRKDQCNPC